MVSSVPSPSTAIEPPSSTKRRVVAAVAEVVDEQAADRRVAVVGRELLAPRVEAEVHAGALARRSSRTKIGPLSRSHESSIGSSTISTSPVSAARASAASCAVGADHGQRLERGDGVGRGGVVGLGLAELAAPELAPARPAHERALVRRPLGRHAEAVGGGRAQCRAFRVRLRSSWRSTTCTIRRMYCSTPVALAWPWMNASRQSATLRARARPSR